jgi:hypothetical protein
MNVTKAIDTRIGKLTFESGYPSQETVTKLYDEMDFQRACQAYLWGIPAVGLEEWRLAHRDIFKAKNGEMVAYLDFKEKLGILTPNFTKSWPRRRSVRWQKLRRECGDRAIAWMRHSKPVNPDKPVGVNAAVSVHGRQRDARSPPLTPWRISRARLVYSQTITQENDRKRRKSWLRQHRRNQTS